MFKIGDRVKVIGNTDVVLRTSNCGRNCLGKIRTVINIKNQESLHAVTLDCHRGGIYLHEIKLHTQREIRNDVDWLDAIQENFKKGV